MPTWKLILATKRYFYWSYQLPDGRTVYNVTASKKPPKGEGGYFDLASLRRAKNDLY